MEAILHNSRVYTGVSVRKMGIYYDNSFLYRDYIPLLATNHR